MVVDGKKSGTPFSPRGCPILRIKNMLRRGGEIGCEGSRGEKHGVAALLALTVFPWQHYAVYDHSASRNARSAT